MQTIRHQSRRRPGRDQAWAASGQKGPPSAPPTIPPIIINPFTREMPPVPAIDPRPHPVRPPLVPPRRPGMRTQRASRAVHAPACLK
jgi:hypothetical protein